MNSASLLRSLRALQWWVWAIPAALVLANLGALIYYQVGYAGKFGQMKGQLDSLANDRSLVVSAIDPSDLCVCVFFFLQRFFFRQS